MSVDFRLINGLCDCTSCKGGEFTCVGNKLYYKIFRPGPRPVCDVYHRKAPTPRRVSMAPGEVILSQARRLG